MALDDKLTIFHYVFLWYGSYNIFSEIYSINLFSHQRHFSIYYLPDIEGPPLQQVIFSILEVSVIDNF